MKFKLKIINFTLCVTLLALTRPVSHAQETNLTSIEKLRNGIPFVIRETPGGEIVTLSVTFMSGSADESFNRRAINQLALDTMTYATKSFSKQKIFALTEKNSIGINCSGGVEASHCSVQTLKEFLPQAVDLLASVVTEPSFNQDDVTLAKQQLVTQFQQEMQNPESQVNAVVNSIFYEQQHPYRLLPQDGIQQIRGLKSADLKAYHSNLVDSSNMFITYAGPKLGNDIKSAIQRKFSKIPKRDRPKKIVVAPGFDPEKKLAFEHRDIPTAYIKMKFNAPSITAKDAAAADLMFEILSERLQDEVRTKRSLSYAVYAGTIQYNQGIGMISVSTSKPKETIDAITAVVKNFKEKGVTAEELTEQRNVFTTSYFLTLESQNSLAGALASFQNYFGNAKKLYDLPDQLAGVTPADVSRVAKEWLKNFRVGVVYDKSKFDAKWFRQLDTL